MGLLHARSRDIHVLTLTRRSGYLAPLFYIAVVKIHKRPRGLDDLLGHLPDRNKLGLNSYQACARHMAYLGSFMTYKPSKSE